MSEAIPVRVALQPLRSALEEWFWESWGGSQGGSVVQLADGLNIDDTLGILDEIAIVLAFAFIGGFIASRLRLPPIVGYLAAGLAVGPFTPGFVADVALAEQLGEIGIVILMFGGGLHFSVRDLLAVRNIAIAGAIVQSVMTTLLSIGAAMLFGWGLGAGLVLGLALSVASTIVMVRALAARDALDTPNGRIAVGWLIVEDIFSALVLVLLPIVAVSLGGRAAGSHTPDETMLDALLHQGDSLLGYGLRLIGLDEGPLEIGVVAFINVALLAGVVLIVGKAIVTWVLDRVEHISEEMFTLAVVMVALFIAVVAKGVFGLSDALGAFLAGVMIGDYRLSHRVAEAIQPLRDIFGVIFFASVGMLLNPATIIKAWLHLLTVVLIVMVAKPLFATAVVRMLRFGRETAAIIAPALGEVGEFSFILAVRGKMLGLLPDEGYQLIISGSMISIALNPLLFRIVESLTCASGTDRQPP